MPDRLVWIAKDLNSAKDRTLSLVRSQCVIGNDSKLEMRPDETKSCNKATGWITTHDIFVNMYCWI